MHGSIASVAALTAQPLAALPPYGCGVPLAGSERLAGWQVIEWLRRPRNAPRFVIPRSEATWESRGGSCAFADGFPTIRPGTARLPRLLRSLAMTNLIACFTRRGTMTKLRTGAVGGQPRRIHMPFPGIATFPNQQTNPPIWDSSSLSAHLSFCGTSSLSASHARLLLSHPVLFQNKLIYEHDIAL